MTSFTPPPPIRCRLVDPATFWTQFHHETIVIKGVRLHFVEGGSGMPILLLPGWPQSWYAWRYVMPLLAQAGRRVIALDRAAWATPLGPPLATTCAPWPPTSMISSRR